MAVIKKSSTSYILENISGQIGGLIFRQKNGKTIVSKRPGKYTTSQDPKCISTRDKFKCVNIFATFVHRIPILAEVWKTAQVQGVFPFTRIVKHNIKKVKEHWPTILNILTPDPCHFLIEDLVLSGDELSLYMEKGFEANESDKLIIIMAAIDPKVPGMDDFVLKDLSPKVNNGFIINLHLSEFRQYKRFIIYCAVIRPTEKGLTWSNTIAIEGSIEI